MFPTLSVTAIGLVVGLGAKLSGHGTWRSGLAALVGAWIGFAIGALLGGVLDVAFGTGILAALTGHAFALAGALASVTLLDRVPGSRTD